MNAMAGQTLVLSGAAGAIGSAVAEQFLAAGANVVFGDLDTDALDRLRPQLDPSGAASITVGLDSASLASNEALVAAAVERFGSIDFLVHGAGIYPEMSIAEMTGEQWRKCLAVNLDGCFYLTRAALPHFNDGSAVVAITSMAGHRGSRNHAHYAASKGGMLSLIRSVAWEMGSRVRANAVAPGIIDTPMTASLRGAQQDYLLAGTPLGRFGTPAEVASVVRFLCSTDAAFVDGEVVQVNGGLHMD